MDVASATEIFATVPTGVVAGTTYAVTVTNADGTTVSFPDAFTAVAPTLDFVNGATKPSGNPGSTVIVEGRAFGDVQGEAKVLFSDGAGGTIEATIASDDDWTDTFILTTVPTDAESGPILVETATGQSESLEFTVTSAATFSPSAIAWTETQALPLTLSGHGAVATSIENGSGTTVQHVYVTGGASNDSVPVSDVYRRHPPRGRRRHALQLQGTRLRLPLPHGWCRHQGWTAGELHQPSRAERRRNARYI